MGHDRCDTHPYGLFLGAINFSKLLQQTAVTGVLAVGMLMVIVSGNIDLSVGAVVGLAGGIAAMTQGLGTFALSRGGHCRWAC